MGKKRPIHLQEEVQKGGDIRDERCTVLTHSSLSCLVKGDFVFLCVRMCFSLFACLYTSKVPAWWAGESLWPSSHSKWCKDDPDMVTLCPQSFHNMLEGLLSALVQLPHQCSLLCCKSCSVVHSRLSLWMCSGVSVVFFLVRDSIIISLVCVLLKHTHDIILLWCRIICKLNSGIRLADALMVMSVRSIQEGSRHIALWNAVVRVRMGSVCLPRLTVWEQLVLKSHTWWSTSAVTHCFMWLNSSLSKYLEMIMVRGQ